MLPEQSFAGRVGIITGGATGIGNAIAREVARLGGRVVLVSRKEENLAKAGGVMLSVIANYAWTGGPGVIHSASAKAGVLAMMRTLAVEWARHKIRANCITPGPVDTPGASSRLFPDPAIVEGIRKTIPVRRFALMEEIVNAAVYLLSDYAAYVTGENLVIDGGQWLSGADYFTRLKQMMPR